MKLAIPSLETHVSSTWRHKTIIYLLQGSCAIATPYTNFINQLLLFSLLKFGLWSFLLSQLVVVTNRCQNCVGWFFWPRTPSKFSKILVLAINNSYQILTLIVVPLTKSLFNMDFPNTKCTQYHTKNWKLKQIEANYICFLCERKHN